MGERDRKREREERERERQEGKINRWKKEKD